MKVKGLPFFIGHACKNYPKEVAGFLFAKNLYSKKEEWMIIPVRNVSEQPENSWVPDKKDMQAAKRIAIKGGYVKIGNIHSHPYQHTDVNPFDAMMEQVKPSDKDLWFARRFNDIVRIIILVKPDAVLAKFIHDKFGNEIEIALDGVD